MSDLSVIIVSYNVRRFLEQAIIAVQKSVSKIKIELIVVDNNSQDDSCKIIKEHYPDVRLIENKNNVGFSKANNQGISISKSKYVLLLNPDTVVSEDTLQKCYDFMESTADCGALGVRMIDGSGIFLPESKRGLPTPKVSFYKIFGLATLFPKSQKFGSYHLKYLSEFETNAVDVLSGAFMFMRKEVLDKIGLLDETFFMYGEDIDLSYRVTLAGYKNYYFADTTIIHYKGESTKKNSLHYVKVFYQAMIIFAEKHFQIKSAKLLGKFIYFAVYLRAFIALLKRLIIKSFPIFIEFILLYLSYFGVTRYWEEYNKWVEGGAYSQEYFVYHLTSYSLILVIGLILGGSYRKYFSSNNLWRGFFIASVMLAIIYAFLPETLRYSRAILFLGAFFGLSILTIYRSVLNFVKNKSFSLGNNKEARILIVGNDSNIEKAQKILFANGRKFDMVERYSFKEEKGLQNIQEYCEVFKVEEVIFCSEDISNKEIIQTLSEKVSSKLNFKILPQNTNFIIGSTDKNQKGDFYTTEKSFIINSKRAVFNKRVFDIITCILLIPFVPFIKTPKGNKWREWYWVLIGKKTWVGYNIDEDVSELPKIKDSVMSLQQNKTRNKNISKILLQKSNIHYAQTYSWKTDLDIITKQFLKQITSAKKQNTQ